jgi:aryl-alcohol dehydrogenase-like predicted oxidoreductase
MQRKIGDVTTSPMGMGCWAIGGPFWAEDTPLGWGEVDDAESTRAVRACLDAGVRYFDTANVYGAGHSERVLGKALGADRPRVFVSTKFGSLFNEETRQVTGGSAEPASVREACEDSLRRLGTDYIDLLFFHFNDHPVEEAEPVRDVLEALVAEGKIRSYGWSTDFPDRARFFAAGEHCSAIQFQENVVDDNPEMIALCEEFGLAGVNRGPLAMGLLTGKYQSGTALPADDVRGSKSPEWMQYFTDGKPSPEWVEKVSAIREILTSGGRSLVQGALGWLWARSERMIPIPGIRTATQAEENCKAMQFGPLAADAMAEIDSLLGRNTGAPSRKRPDR